MRRARLNQALSALEADREMQSEIDVQTGNGRVNYISGYVAKDHDSVDEALGEVSQPRQAARLRQWQ